MPSHYYWDACVFLAFLKREEGRIEIVREMLRRGELGELVIVTSSFTPAEVVHVKGRDRITSDIEQAIDDLFSYDFIRMMDVTRKVSEHARKLMWKYSHLRPKDAVHLASAIQCKERITELAALHTYDPHFLKLNGVAEAQFALEIPILNDPELPFPNDGADTETDENEKPKVETVAVSGETTQPSGMPDNAGVAIQSSSEGSASNPTAP